MANTPQFSTTLSEPKYDAEIIVNKLAGSEGPSVLETVGRVAKAGAEGYEAYRTYKIKGIQEGISKEVGSLIEEANLGSPSKRQEVQDEKATSEYLLKAIPSDVQADEYKTPLLDKIKSSLDFLTKAESQRRMSPFELQSRGLAVVRNALSNNPGYRKEILTTVANAFEDQGIIDRLKYDDSLAKNEQEAFQAQQKEIRKNLEEHHIPLGPFQVNGVVDVAAAQKVLDMDNESIYKYTLAERALKSGDVANKMQVQTLISTGEHTKISNGLVKSAWLKAQELLNSGLTYDKLVPVLEKEIDTFIESTNTSFGKVSFDPTIKATMEDTLSRLKTIKQTVKDAGSLENAKTYHTNVNNIQTIAETSELREAVGNLQKFDVMQKLSTNPFISKLLADNQTGLVKQVLKNLSDMGNGLRVGREHLAPIQNGPSAAAISFEASSAAIAGGNTQGSRAFNITTGDRINAINTLENVDQRFTASEDYIKQLADPKNLGGIQALDAETKTSSFNLILDHSKALSGSLKKLTEKEGVSFSFDADGKLALSGVTRQDNADIVNRINTDLTAFANVRGLSTKQASNEFFSNVYSNVFKPTEVPSMESENKAKALKLMPSLMRVETNNRHTDASGKLITSPKGAEGITQVMPATGRRPGFGITPLDYTKKGEALKQEYIRFAEDYLTASLNLFNGDESKALASYNAGIPAVQAAVAKANKSGKPAEWVSYLPKETKDYLTKANLPSNTDLNASVASLRKSQLDIKASNPDVYKSLFNDSNVEMAKDIALDLKEKYNINASYEEVFQILEKSNTLDKNPSASQTKEADAYNTAKLILNTPDLYNRYSPKDQEAIARIVDKPLEGVYPEEFLMLGGLVKKVAGKALSAFANRNMPGYAKVLEKASERVKNVTPKPAASSVKYEPTPVKKLIEEAKKKYTPEENLRSSVARAAEKLAKDKAKPIEESARSVAANAARVKNAKARAARAAKKAENNG